MKTYQLLFAMLFLALVSMASAAPKVINYQGRLTDTAGQPITTSTVIDFTFYDAESGGNQLTFADQDTVTPDSNGFYSTLIGDAGGPEIPATLFQEDNVFLNVMVNGENLVPRTRVTSSAYALTTGLERIGSAYLIVETTDDAAQNGTNLILTYDRARGMTNPNGQAKSASNRLTVLLPPAVYEVGTNNLYMDSEFVDVIGISSARREQVIQGSGEAVVYQAANDMRLENVWVRSMRTADTDVGDPTASTPAAFWLTSASSNMTVIRNCEFSENEYFVPPSSWRTTAISMRAGQDYQGTYENCKANRWAFGYGSTSKASGTFRNCIASASSFGGRGIASGTFVNCEAGG
jgi:hypothetical protein